VHHRYKALSAHVRVYLRAGGTPERRPPGKRAKRVVGRKERGVRMPKLVSIVLFAGSAVFLILALVLALTKGVLDVSVLDFSFVVLPRYLLLLAAILFTAGWIVRRLLFSHP
jgi:hypothetical protein